MLKKEHILTVVVQYHTIDLSIYKGTELYHYIHRVNELNGWMKWTVRFLSSSKRFTWTQNVYRIVEIQLFGLSSVSKRIILPMSPCVKNQRQKYTLQEVVLTQRFEGHK